MKGERVDRVARLLLRDETYRLIVAPAIADLHFEDLRGLERARACTGAWLALLYALSDDLTSDAVQALRAMAMPLALRHAAWTAAVATCAVSVPFALDLENLAGPPWLLTVLILPSSAAIALLPALTLGARAAWGRGSSTTRGFVIAAVGFAAFIFVFIDQGVTRTNQMFREVDGHARGIETVRKGARELSVAELLRPDSDVAAINVGHANQFAREAHLRMALGASCIAYVLFGLALARTRLEIAAATAAAIWASHFTLMALMTPVLILSNRVPALLVPGVWMPTIILTTVAIITLRLQAYTRKAG